MPPGRPREARAFRRSRAARPAVAVLSALVGLTLGGCSFLAQTSSEPTASETTTVSVEEAAVVDEVVAALEPVLHQDDAPFPDSARLFEVLTDAGYPAEDLEASLDESPLGHEVPSKMFGVKTDRGCVVGEVRDGEATAELVPESESNGSCLLGEVDRPEGVEAPTGEERAEGADDNGKGHLPHEDINGDPAEPESADSGAGAEPDSGADDEGRDAGSGSSSGSSGESTLGGTDG